MRPITFFAAIFGVVIIAIVAVPIAILIAIVIAYETVTGVISDRRHMKHIKDNDEKQAAIRAAIETAEEETK